MNRYCLVLLFIFSSGLCVWAQDPMEDPSYLERREALLESWSKAPTPLPEPSQIRVQAGETLWVRLRLSELPGKVLSSRSPVGQRVVVLAVEELRKGSDGVVPSGSLLGGVVLEAKPYEKEPFQPAQLKLFFYQLILPNGSVYPVTGVVRGIRRGISPQEKTPFTLSDGGTFLHREDIVLQEGTELKIVFTSDFNLYPVVHKEIHKIPKPKPPEPTPKKKPLRSW